MEHNPEEHIEFGDGYDIVKVINCKNNEDFGLITRFCTGSLARNPMILLQDDDFILHYESLVKLRDEWIKEPDCFHTFFGRGPKEDGTYGEEYFPKAPICGRLYVIDRKYCGLILHEYWNLDEHMRNLIHTKGDDILASYVMTHYTGNLHSVHKIDYQLFLASLVSNPPSYYIVFCIIHSLKSNLDSLSLDLLMDM